MDFFKANMETLHYRMLASEDINNNTTEYDDADVVPTSPFCAPGLSFMANDRVRDFDLGQKTALEPVSTKTRFYLYFFTGVANVVFLMIMKQQNAKLAAKSKNGKLGKGPAEFGKWGMLAMSCQAGWSTVMCVTFQIRRCWMYGVPCHTIFYTALAFISIAECSQKYSLFRALNERTKTVIMKKSKKADGKTKLEKWALYSFYGFFGSSLLYPLVFTCPLKITPILIASLIVRLIAALSFECINLVLLWRFVSALVNAKKQQREMNLNADKLDTLLIKTCRGGAIVTLANVARLIIIIVRNAVCTLGCDYVFGLWTVVDTMACNLCLVSMRSGDNSQKPKDTKMKTVVSAGVDSVGDDKSSGESSRTGTSD